MIKRICNTQDYSINGELYIGTRGVFDELIVELLVNTGLRASELCNLNIGDLPIKHGKDCPEIAGVELP